MPTAVASRRPDDLDHSRRTRREACGTSTNWNAGAAFQSCHTTWPESRTLAFVRAMKLKIDFAGRRQFLAEVHGHAIFRQITKVALACSTPA